MSRVAALTALLALSAVAVSLVLGELLLRALTGFPISEDSNTQTHAELLYTAHPGYPEIDSHGFRNPMPLRDRYEVVAVGDSHTYGSNAGSAATWPARVAAASGASTYNMGMGGYSIYQYDVLFDQALRMSPEQVIVALYPANDWMPDCALLRLPAWAERVERNGLQPPCETSADPAAPPAAPESLRSWARRSAIGSAVATLILEPFRYVWLPRLGFGDAAGPELVQYQVGGRTFSFGVSRLRNHARGTDLSEPPAAAAYADGLRLLRRWRDAAQSGGVRLAVLIIPSKELVLRSWALEHGHALPQELRAFTDNEAAAFETLMRDLGALQLRYVSALPSVVARFDEAVRAGQDMYPPGLDGHPYAAGYAAYAEAALALFGNGRP